MSAAAPLSGQDLERARAMRERFLEVMPDALPFLESLVREGIIRGWRDVEWVGTLAEGEAREQRHFAGRAFSVAHMRDLNGAVYKKGA